MPLYFIGIVAPAHINERVLEWKGYMLDRFGCKVALRSPAHVTLIPPFNQKEENQNDLFSAVNKYAWQRNSFTVELEDFSAFPPRVIFIKVGLSDALKNLHADINEYMVQKFPVKKSDRPFHPHITIANRDLSKRDFREAFSYFKNLEYHDTFIADHIHILKSYGSGWEVVSAAPLNTS